MSRGYVTCLRANLVCSPCVEKSNDVTSTLYTLFGSLEHVPAEGRLFSGVPNWKQLLATVTAYPIASNNGNDLINGNIYMYYMPHFSLDA